MQDEESQVTPKDELKQLAIRLGVLQREANKLEIPVLVVIEALDASDKGKLLNQMLLEIDSRSRNVYSTHASHTEPREYPLLWRFWKNTPEKGKIQFYDRSAYYLALDAWVEEQISAKSLDRYWEEIRRFERQLHDDGIQIVKLFLTISKKIQAKRLKKLESNPSTSWRVRPKDWKRNSQHKQYVETVESMMEKTEQPFARWTCIDTENYTDAAIRMFAAVTQKLETAIEEEKAKRKSKDSKPESWIPYQSRDYLSETSSDKQIDRAEYKQALKKRQATIHQLAHEIHYHEIPVVMAYCGWDAAGKGGCIKRLVQSIDPRGYEVFPVAAPTPIELRHHYLWRFWKEMPKKGRISIFDRSWYGRVLVERVEGLCKNDEWQRAYREINEMEEHLDSFGTVIIKFWLQIDKDTQLERFEARQDDPLKQWKITDEDWRNREKWDLYVESVNEMIDKTNTDFAPWNIVPSKCKLTARIATLDIIIDRLKAAIKKGRKSPL